MTILYYLIPDKKNDLLIEDISKRTGIEIEKVRIRRIDLIKSNAVLDVYYRGEKSDPEVQ